MVIISNSDRDKTVHYLGMLCNSIQGVDTRSKNVKRIAHKLAKRLQAKQTIKMIPCQKVTESSENE